MAQSVGSHQTEQFILDATREFIEPLTVRSAFKASRLAILHDGTTTPVLELLAKRKFDKWPEEQFPFWIDGDRRHELLANVGLATRASNGGPQRRSAFGVPAGTKEYMKLWRAANRSRMKASQDRYAAKQKRVLEAAVEAAEHDPVLAKLLRATQKEPIE